jgi:hypothetical protein
MGAGDGVAWGVITGYLAVVCGVALGLDAAALYFARKRHKAD